MSNLLPIDIMTEYDNLLIKIYYEKKLNCLSGLDFKFLLNGKNIITEHSDVVRRNAIKYKGEFNYRKNFDDLLYFSNQLMYFTALLFLYRPYINNPLNDAYEVDGEKYSPNFQNLYSANYDIFADCACQAAYNYWDRIGDLIASFFPNELNPKRIFFNTALEIIPQEFEENIYFKWLKNFLSMDYKELNGLRVQVVHYTSIGTEYKHQHNEYGFDNEIEMERIQAEREKIPDFYKKHINLTLEGFEKTLGLLDEISNVIFSDNE